MTMWRITRIEAPLVQGVILECDPNENQGVVTLEEESTGTGASLSVCVSRDPGHVETMLNVLTDAGFTPNDWS